MHKRNFLLACFMIFVMVSCSPAAPTVQQVPTASPAAAQPSQTHGVGYSLGETAEIVIQHLADSDMAGLAAFVHPDLGVRFSPYAYVREDHLRFMPDQVEGLMDDPRPYPWGNYDGTGDPIQLTFEAYYQAFVYPVDFANAEEVAFDRVIGQGNTINNLQTFYPDSRFVEYHFSGFDPAYGGMDWQSLRLVFTEEQGQWFLIGIIHDAWTI
jgi:hypothetical protein